MRKYLFLDLVDVVVLVLFVLVIPKWAAGQGFPQRRDNQAIPTFPSAPVVVVKDPPDPRPDPEQDRRGCLLALAEDNRLAREIYELKSNANLLPAAGPKKLPKILKEKQKLQKKINEYCSR